MANRNDAAVIALCQGRCMALAWTSKWNAVWTIPGLTNTYMDDAESTLYLPWTYRGHKYWT